MPLPAGRSERRKTGEHRPCLHTRLRLVKRSEPIFELVGRETAVGHVLAEDLRDPISIGVTGAEVARVRLARVANRCGRRRGRGQTQRLLAPRDSLGVPFALLRLLLLDERAAVELDFRPVHGVIAHRDDSPTPAAASVWPNARQEISVVKPSSNFTRSRYRQALVLPLSTPAA